MAFGSFDSNSTSTTMSEINMVPLIDVMLVLLVIFMITAPLLTHTIRVNVPQVSAQPAEEKPQVIDLAIDAQGALFWNEQPVAPADLESLLAQQAVLDPQPEVRIRADVNTRYGQLAEIMAQARRAGIKRLGFVTHPGMTPASALAHPQAAALGASPGR
ncbi:MAG TPA: biopolymer transporter ExbD [Castellaniella sp.]|uniref:ExbD/TolR family protein n=1 Tax=Castellaniella sp. TaxID=1955812 RepID=UPI002EDD384E